MASVHLPPPFEAYAGGDPYLFASYAHADAAQVYPLLAHLHAEGCRVWYDEGIDPGNEWTQDIARALARCAYFIVFITPRSVQSHNVRNEINFAIARRKPFLAIHLEETALPDGLELQMGGIQALMRYRMDEASYCRKLFKTLPPSLLPGSTAGEAVPPPSDGPFVPGERRLLGPSYNLPPADLLATLAAGAPSDPDMADLRAIVAGPEWMPDRRGLPIALGRTAEAKDIVADLATLPHLLIGGDVQAEVPEFLQTIVAGWLTARSPADLRLLLIDPVVSIFDPFRRIPHLLSPPLADPHASIGAFRWLIAEMERRYKVLATCGVRDIAQYNARKGSVPHDALPMPRMAAVVSELADLMMADSAEAEMAICRLAQLSRPTGIHVVAATRRPVPDVLPATLMSNMTGRIAFHVEDARMSRLLVCASGAEKLAGGTELLYLGPEMKTPLRLRRAGITEAELAGLTAHCGHQAAPDFVPMGGSERMDDEERLIADALAAIKTTGRASTSMIMRRLRLGYTRSARIMDTLEERGYVSPLDAHGQRTVLVEGAATPSAPEPEPIGDLPTPESAVDQTPDPDILYSTRPRVVSGRTRKPPTRATGVQGLIKAMSAFLSPPKKKRGRRTKR